MPTFITFQFTCLDPGLCPQKYRKWAPTVNDPQTAIDPRPQVIPIVDRKWSREENQNGQDSSYWIILPRLLSQQKGFNKLNTFNKLMPRLKKKKKETVKLHLKLSSINKTQRNAGKKKT